MPANSEQWVPKIHPITRSVEPEDPMELVATPVQGDPDFMLECVLQEFVWMGWDRDQLMALFYSPHYPVLNQLLARFGDHSIRGRIDDLLQRTGRLRFSERIVEDEEPGE